MDHEELMALLRSAARVLIYDGHLDIVLNGHMDMHPKEEVEVGERKAEIDVDLVPLVLSLWEQGCETVCSCQDMGGATGYVQFMSAEHGANRMDTCLGQAGIEHGYNPHTLDAPLGAGMTLRYSTVIITFPSASIPAITEAVQAGLPE